MPVLNSQQRKLLDDACVKGRRTSEQAVRAALGSLAVAAERPPAHLTEEDRQLRRGLRAKSRQLGDQGDRFDLLVAECAYEQWHRLLFARFLAENGLLIHPEYRAPLTLEDCDDLADALDEPDGWSVASRFAAEILPGIFRLDDPCVQLRLAPEGRLALEGVVARLPREVFLGDDALGWVYQSWQKEQKDEVNDSERKVGGADLGPVTQLFTENYMVRFLLENSLGAWWASHNPNSPLLAEWKYLRRIADGAPAAGAFAAWPSTVAELTVMDPCCGSGHFLVEAFVMLWRMRAEEEQLSVTDAQDAVLRDNLFGLELDPRCVQIAMFAIALSAWKAAGGWRHLPVPHVACSGVPVRSSSEQWASLAGGDERIARALVRLNVLFRDADTLGSLIDPVRSTELTDPTGLQTSLDDVSWDELAPVLDAALANEASDPASIVLGARAAGVARAADYLSRTYTLIVTNVPFLSVGKQSDTLRRHLELRFPSSSQDLATAMVERALSMARTVAVVTPQSWQQQQVYKEFRRKTLEERTLDVVARVGNDVWQRSGAGTSAPFKLHTALTIITNERASNSHSALALDVGSAPLDARASALRLDDYLLLNQLEQRANPEHRIVLSDRPSGGHPPLADFVESLQGLATGDFPRFGRFHWEVDTGDKRWARLQSTVVVSVLYGGRESVVDWSDGRGALASFPGARVQGIGAWGRYGVAVSQMGDLKPTLYTGEIFDNNVAAIVPRRKEDLGAVWAFLRSPEYAPAVRNINSRPGVTNGDLVKVEFDIERWREVALSDGPIAEPSSDDPTQWLFNGRPDGSTEPLQVAVGRLVGHRWPEQPEADDLSALEDDDGIVCLPSVRGERTAADRLQEMLARAFGGTWSPARTRELLAASGSKKPDLDAWLRDDFFKAHCQVFKSRPFVWQIWDGRKDGFSALINYQRLGRPTLEKLTYSYLGDWIERQTAGVREDVAGAEERLAAARVLQQKLELILDGEPPYDIYVRWKPLAEQPIGWSPDLNDGVRLNVRPFVMAGVLRSKFNVKWDKDRGKDPDGSERVNDRHYTNAQKQAAQGVSA